MEFEYPTYKETLNHIEQLKQIDWEKYDGNDLDKYIERTHKQLTNIIQVHPSILLSTPLELPFDFQFFRVRKTRDINNIYLRSEYSYPPAIFAKDNLRANLIGNPVFYCSDHPFVALLEYLDQWENPSTYLEDDFVISGWKLRKGKEYFIAPFIPESTKEVNEFAALATFTNDEFREKTKTKIEDEKIDAMRVMNDYLAGLFLDDKKRTISSYLGYYYLYKNPIKPCIFIYPSIKAERGECNYALHPNFVDENIILSHIWRIKFNWIKKEQRLMEFNFKLINNFGFNENSYIRWTSFEKNEDAIKNQFKTDFKKDLILKMEGN